MKAGDKKEARAAETRQPSVVKCDVCGHDFNRSYLKSHKRLSHGKRDNAAVRTVDESETVELIRVLYLQLPPASRKNLLKRLADMLEGTSE